MYMCCTESNGQSRASSNGVCACVCVCALTDCVVWCRALDLEQRYTVRVITGLM